MDGNSARSWNYILLNGYAGKCSQSSAGSGESGYKGRYQPPAEISGGQRRKHYDRGVY